MLLKVAIVFCLTILFYAEGSVQIIVKVSDYQNYGDVKANGNRCEKFTFFSDYCDPFFKICIGTTWHGCDVARQETSAFKNKWAVKNIFSGIYSRTYYPDYLRINVKIFDREHFQGHELIADFRKDIREAPGNYQYDLNKRAGGKLISLKISATIKCAYNYYGGKCSKYCKPSHNNYSCDKNGVKKCVLKCKNGGKCQWKSWKSAFVCSCVKGWSGPTCGDHPCKSLKCINGGNCTANELKTKYHCSCPNGFMGQRCEHVITSPPTTTTTPAPTPTTTSTPTITSTVKLPGSISSASPSTRKHIISMNATKQHMGYNSYQKGSGSSPLKMSYMLAIGFGFIALSLVCVFVFWRWRRKVEERKMRKKIESQVRTAYFIPIVDNCNLYDTMGVRVDVAGGQRDSGVYEEPKMEGDNEEDVYEECN